MTGAIIVAVAAVTLAVLLDSRVALRWLVILVLVFYLLDAAAYDAQRDVVEKCINVIPSTPKQEPLSWSSPS